MMELPGNMRVTSTSDLQLLDAVVGTKLWVEAEGRFREAVPYSSFATGDIAGPGDITRVAWRLRTEMQVNDLPGLIDAGTAVSGLTYDSYRDTPAKIYCMRHDQDDSVTLKYQMRHDTVWTIPIVPHAHLKPMSNGSGNIILDGYWAFESETLALPALVGWTAFSVIQPVVAADQYKTLYVPLATINIPAEAQVNSSILWVYLLRNGTGLDDTYTTNKDHGTIQANVGLVYTDTHVTVWS